MRVLLVTANYRPSVGGIERFVEILAGGLAERGHEVTVATCRREGTPVEETERPVRVVRIPASHWPHRHLNVPYPIPAPRACARTVRTLLGSADVVHAQDALYLTTVASLALASRAGVPSVLTQHVSFVPQGRCALDAAQRAAIATLGRSSRCADVVTAYNPSVAAWARSRWRLSDVRLLPTGVPPPPPADEDDRIAVRRELGLPDDAFVALFAGRDVPKKRLDVFLESADASYLLVAVTDRVQPEPPAGARLVPFMPPGRFSRLLSAVDAFVLPSEAEGFPLTLQEALVAGVPCVVTREPGYERYLRDGEATFVEPDPRAIRAELRALSAESARRHELAERARMAGNREFGVDRFIDAYESLYAELAHGTDVRSVPA